MSEQIFPRMDFELSSVNKSIISIEACLDHTGDTLEYCFYLKPLTAADVRWPLLHFVSVKMSVDDGESSLQSINLNP